MCEDQGVPWQMTPHRGCRGPGVATHVLRHWEDESVVVPDRSAAGHWLYAAEHLARCRIVLSYLGVGMSLADIRSVLHRGAVGRAEVIGTRISAIRAPRSSLDSAEKFLLHVRQCRCMAL